MEEHKYKIIIQDKNLLIQELTIEQSGDFLGFVLSAFKELDLTNLEDPIDLIKKAVKIATDNFADFAHAIFKGQDTKNIDWQKVKMAEGIKIINFFFRCNKESVEGLQELWQSSASKESVNELVETIKESQPSTIMK